MVQSSPFQPDAIILMEQELDARSLLLFLTLYYEVGTFHTFPPRMVN